MRRLVFVLFLVVFPACGGDLVVNVNFGAVQGTVTDATLRITLSGATVTIQGRSATTNAAGQFAVSELDAGPATLTVVKAGYQTRNVSVTVPRDQSAKVEIALMRG